MVQVLLLWQPLEEQCQAVLMVLKRSPALPNLHFSTAHLWAFVLRVTSLSPQNLTNMRHFPPSKATKRWPMSCEARALSLWAIGHPHWVMVTGAAPKTFVMLSWSSCKGVQALAEAPSPRNEQAHAPTRAGNFTGWDKPEIKTLLQGHTKMANEKTRIENESQLGP